MKKTFLFFSILFLSILTFYTCNKPKKNFLHRAGTQIVDGNNQEFFSKGMGLGGWMLQEGYMVLSSSFAGTQHEYRAKIEELIGKEGADEFYSRWYANHCTKTDIDSLASWGFNCIRLPMHYNLYTLPIEAEPVKGQNTWLDRGFVMTDSLLSWCKANKMYLILDLHAAPGGQGNNASISDYDTTKHSLWESDENKAKTIALWGKLAERYADEEWIGGYDLLNETNWNFDGKNLNGCEDTLNVPLKQLLQDITTEIRKVDKNHIVIIEGNCWGNNYKGIMQPWDSNMVYSFHKYWNPNTKEAIQWALDLRQSLNVPIWLGETGENSNEWFTDCIKLMNENKIGWAWWPMKKIQSIVGPLTVPKTDAYQQLLDYWEGKAEKPDKDFAYKTLMEVTDLLKISNCIYRPDVIYAIKNQPYTDQTAPFKKLSIPGIIFCSDFDMGKQNIAYNDLDFRRTGEENEQAGNKGRNYRNDGVDIDVCTDKITNGFSIGWTEPNEWLTYTVMVEKDGIYDLNIRYASEKEPSSVHFEMDNAPLGKSLVLKPTKSWQNWQMASLNGINLTAGKHTLKLVIEKAGANLNYVEFVSGK